MKKALNSQKVAPFVFVLPFVLSLLIFWAYPLTWSLSSLLFTVYYRKADWIHQQADRSLRA